MAEQTPHQNVSFDSASGKAFGYLATPESGRGPAVIVIQEWWGLVDHIKDICDRLAAQGFVALAPDLYGGRTTHDAAEAGEIMAKLPAEQGAKLLGGAVDYLLGLEAVTSKTVGAIGFCMGGGFVLALAAQQGERVSAAVPFYGVGQGIPNEFSGIKAAVQGHYAEQDTSYPVAEARKQERQIAEESGTEVTYYYYDAPHAFANDSNPAGNYREEHATTAWNRAVQFLSEKVR